MIIDSILTKFSFLRRLDPNIISGFGLVCSLLVYFLISEKMLIGSVIALFLVLFLDALDGVVARLKGRTSSEEGWIVDVSVDRVSDALISLALSRVYILLVILNIGLTFCSYKFKRHLVIPLRQLLLLMLLFCLFAGSDPIAFLLDGILFEW